MTDHPNWRDNPRWRLTFLDSLLRLAPTGPAAVAKVLELGTEPHGGSGVELARTYGSCVSLSTSSHVTAAARNAAPSDAQVTYRRRYPLLSGSPADAPYDLVVGWHFERHFPHALLRQVPDGRIVSPICLDQPNPGPAFAVIHVRTLTALLALPRRSDPPTQWDTFPGNVVRHPDVIGVTCGCTRCDPPDPPHRTHARPTPPDTERCFTVTPPMLTLVA